ncbi:uncharacterized protein LOC113749757 isoform X1 [Coffea eugenioides]|uniref:uncharacterized protein LOC113749757 isoform X1 n=1 Tax=Coffea eugenioides TaxID=49369 RepID=UPI000F613239|nr:uncharacterized protein LOC113749757 isoform X1 [Coffea eugenioides]
MALNPLVFPNSMPVPFVNEIFVLARDGVDFEVDKIPGAQRGHDKAKGISYLSNIRMVFVANKPGGDFAAFDLPLVSWLCTFCSTRHSSLCYSLKHFVVNKVTIPTARGLCI